MHVHGSFDGVTKVVERGVHAWDVSRSLEDVSHRFSLWGILMWFMH
jgi:hypothetical protein